jgi:hypothetical protein
MEFVKILITIYLSCALVCGFLAWLAFKDPKE